MTQEQAARIGQYVIDAGLDGQIYRIANGEHARQATRLLAVVIQ